MSVYVCARACVHVNNNVTLLHFHFPTSFFRPFSRFFFPCLCPLEI